MSNRPRCCIATCNESANSRGLCTGHYLAARKVVVDGKTTWKKLEKLGKSKPLKQTSKWADAFR